MRAISFFEVLAVVTALALGNFAYQALFTDVANWLAAIERSWFQAFAVLVAWWMWK